MSAADQASQFGTIYREHFPLVFAVCMKMTRNYHDAEDLSQQAFLQAWRGFSNFEGRCLASTWLHIIAVRTVLTEIRSHKNRVTVSLDEEIEESGHGFQEYLATPDLQLESLPDRLALHGWIQNLTPAGRKIVALRLQGLKLHEAAKHLGITLGTAKGNYHRAVTELRRQARVQ